MSYTLKTIKSNRANYGLTRKLSDIKFIVWHYTGTDGGTAENNGKAFKSHIWYTSAHRFIDSKHVINSVPFSYIAWHCGPDPGGKYYHASARNANSIGIELCDEIVDGTIKLSPATRANAVAYGKVLCKNYGISYIHNIRHYDVTHKSCPAYWCGSASKNKEFTKFLTDIFGGFTINKAYTLTKKCYLYTGVGKGRTSTRYDVGTSLTFKDLRYTKKGNLYGLTSKGWVCLIYKNVARAE